MGSALGNGRRALADEVPAGYKRTEVGVIPEDWQIVDIGSLNPFVTSGSRGWARFYAETGAPFIRISNLTRQSIDLELSDLKTVSLPSQGNAEASRTQLQDEDILISITADIGIIGIVDSRVSKPAYMNQHIALIRFDKTLVCARFVAYSLASAGSRRLFVASMDIGAKAGMSLLTVRKIRFALPPFPEQRAIAEALSDVDELLAALEALIAKKRAVKQAAMQQLFTGKSRLPGFSGAWVEKPLRDLTAITMGQSPPSISYNLRGEGLPLIQGNADIVDRQTLDRVWTTQVSKRCDSGDLLLTVRAPVGTVAVARKAACLGRGVCGLKPIGDSAFLFHALVNAEDRWRILEQGSTFTAANSEQVGQFCLRAPTDESEQRAIAIVLSDMDAEIAVLEHRRDKTRAVKQGMMQQLLTGQVRLVSDLGNEDYVS